MSTRSVNSAIYRPRAEGVAEVYAADPAVAGAGLDEDHFVRLFVALIDQESRFNPLALSPKGARGLGQLMPQTAALLGVDDPSDPMENLHGAVRHLTAQLAEFGRVDWALAAYNAGPHRIAQFHGIPPFRETRDYVAKITGAADVGPAIVEARQRGDARAAATPGPEAARALTSVPDEHGLCGLDLRRSCHPLRRRDHPRRLRVSTSRTGAASCFQALTRPVSMMGLPLTYVIILAMLVMGGFIATLSFVYLTGSAVVGHAALRALAVWDPRIFDVILTSLRRTPLPAAWLRGKGIVYCA